MKKLFTVFVLAFLAANINILSGDRMVLVERFTSWTCPPCYTNNPIMETWLNSVDHDRIVGIAYHMNWPAPGNDTFFITNPGDNTARRNFYSVNAIPQARMDGLINIQSPYSGSGLTSHFNTRTNLLSPITVIVTDTTVGDTITVRVKIYTEVLMSSVTASVHISLQERERHYTNAPGTNQEKDFYDIMRKMNEGGTGQTVNLLAGETITLERKFYKHSYYLHNQLMPIVFIQQGQEILNAGKLTSNFTMIPTSGYKSVLQGQNQSATYDMSVPVVAAGYNSPVTLSAEVDPPTPGITVSFPGGNNVSTFPSNFTVQVNSTSAVPTGAYRIIITGTNTNNKVHKTSVSYLVGQNFISVGANRPSLQFKVDGQTYSSSKMFGWNIGSQHELSALTQTVGNVRYVFNNWSNGGDSTQTITTSSNISNYTVNYKTQFKLIANASPSVPVTIAGGNLYHDSASTVNFSVSPLQVEYNGKTYYFQRWNGTGNGSYSGTEPNATITNMNNVIIQSAVFDTIAPIGITNLNTGVPKTFGLAQNFPNPFNPVTKIKFDIPKFTNAVIKVYDIVGNEVAVIHSGELQPGFYEAEFNAASYASGVYFYRLETPEYTNVKRMILVK